ncbi:hypothetical protein [Gimesia aquarii]|uniref:Uncharacterized protein n=1 Tax=Gimesia aquarii TaxID=2527964 RepID=A0A517VZT0_9PLAN|nr:hypothetical protein [Gimesia aquarii]QDT98513.1 hypothetical protein V144x_40190 [Gimesia aquarii]
MDSRVLLSFTVACFVTAPLCAEPIATSKPRFESRPEAEQRAIDVLREWSAQHVTCTAVRGDFKRLWYDDVFRVQKHGKGQFGYLSPRHGFWKIEPAKLDPSSVTRKQTSDGKPYTYKDAESEHWRWQKTRLLTIQEEEKHYEEFYTYVDKIEEPKQKVSWWFFDFDFVLTADFPSPFLPGVPNQARVDDLFKNSYLKVVKESETQIIIAGKPIRRENAPNCIEFKLLLEKQPWRLRATQYIHLGGNSHSVYIFSNIEMNPLEWDEPDLSGYQNCTEKIRNSPLEARKPVKAN